MDKVFAEGLRIIMIMPPSTAPAFVKCRLAIDVAKFTKFMEDHANERGFVDMDVLESKNGESWYAQLNTWKPEKSMPGSAAAGPTDNINPDDIPF